jgi:hypothetical protein
MEYWITTHFPHAVPDTIAWNIFFKKHPRKCPAIGDRILFYETGSASPGTKRRGRQGLVKCGIVAGGIRPVLAPNPPWVLEVPCDVHNGKLVLLAAIRKIIPTALFFRTSVWSLNAAEYNALAALAGAMSPGSDRR